MNLTLDRQSIADFPTFLWIPEPRSVFREVKALPKGHYMEIGINSPSRILPYEKKQSAEFFESEEEAVCKIRNTVDLAIKSRLLSEVEVGAFLSGGLDSSIIATIASNHLSSLTTFCIGFEPANDPYHGKADESKQAAKTADRIGSKHYTIQISAKDFRNSLETFCWHGDQPFGVSSGLGILHIAKKAREIGIKVLLSGDGADECFGGYSWYEHLAIKNQLLETNQAPSVLFAHDVGLTLTERLEGITHLPGPERARAWHYYASEDDKDGLFNKGFIEDLQCSTAFSLNGEMTPNGSPKTSSHKTVTATFLLKC